ncbi:MAG: hypothetical protein IKA87_02135 [Lentisphaeria bacterium]|nr:hypothetical protein [Lentisphaeria bacterium]
MKKHMPLFAAVLLLCFAGGCYGPVLRVGDKFVPVKKYKGIKVLNLPGSVFKEIHYSTFGFDWDAKAGFLIPLQQNGLNTAFWASELTQAEKLYSVVFSAKKMRHYIQDPDIEVLKKYLVHSYQEIPGSKIKRLALEIKECDFKNQKAVRVYMETLETGRELYLREESYIFFDPLRPDTSIYQVSWSERGRKNDWKSQKAEVQGKRFTECFKLLDRKKEK